MSHTIGTSSHIDLSSQINGLYSPPKGFSPGVIPSPSPSFYQLFYILKVFNFSSIIWVFLISKTTSFPYVLFWFVCFIFCLSYFSCLFGLLFVVFFLGGGGVFLRIRFGQKFQPTTTFKTMLYTYVSSNQIPRCYFRSMLLVCTLVFLQELF